MLTEDFYLPSGQRVFALQDAVAIVMLNLKHLSRSDEILGKHDYALTGIGEKRHRIRDNYNNVMGICFLYRLALKLSRY